MKALRRGAFAVGAVGGVGLGVYAVVEVTREPEKIPRGWNEDERRADASAEKPLTWRKPKVTVHVMPSDPFSAQVETALSTARGMLGPDTFDVRLEFVGIVKESGELDSYWGPNEVTAQRFQVCAQKHAAAKQLEVNACQAAHPKAIHENWAACASEAGVSSAEIDAVTACATGPEGTELLRASFRVSEAAKATRTPMVFIDGVKVEGGRGPNDLAKRICATYELDRPDACDAVKSARKVRMTILTDARCLDCETDLLESYVKSSVGTAAISRVDYKDPAAPALLALVEPFTLLPLLIVDVGEAAGDPEASVLTRTMRRNGSSYIMLRGDWRPECADPGGCTLYGCSREFICRAETPATLDVYTRSRSILSTPTLRALPEVMKNFKGNGAAVAVEVHYIGEQRPDGTLTSIGGAAEVDDDLRNVCVAKHYPPISLDYLACRALDREGAWTPCATANGVDVAEIDACASGPEGANLLAASFKRAEDARVIMDPVLVVNGRYQVGAVYEAEWIKAAVCTFNTLAGCDVTLSGAEKPPHWNVPNRGTSL